jgi:hypothetical protein
LDDLVQLEQIAVAIGTDLARHMDAAIDLLGGGRGPGGGGMSFGPAGLFAALFQALPTKGVGLTMRLAARLVEFGAQAPVVFFEASEAAVETTQVGFESVDALVQALVFTFELTAPRTNWSNRHGNLATQGMDGGGSIKEGSARCKLIVGVKKRPERKKMGSSDSIKPEDSGRFPATQIDWTVNKYVKH